MFVPSYGCSEHMYESNLLEKGRCLHWSISPSFLGCFTKGTYGWKGQTKERRSSERTKSISNFFKEEHEADVALNSLTLISKG
mmetsp:Transcript_13678/g.17913  ORF Transcript_13678/g.17913 Transcript_13678/m.17913 type:complete len:83 (-) Transcript_13678:1-249(-)